MKVANMFSAIHALLYFFCAAVAFVASYPFYTTIKGLGMSNIASITITLIWWIIAFTVVYMGTIWIYEGEGKTTRDNKKYGLDLNKIDKKLGWK